MFTAEEIETGKIYETTEVVFSEEDLIVGILWEGDLEIHTNMEQMKTSVFGERIVHGDSVAAKAIGQILNFDIFKWATTFDLKMAKYSFLSPVYIDDNLGVSFMVESKENKGEKEGWQFNINFEVFKNTTEKKTVSKGGILLVAA